MRVPFYDIQAQYRQLAEELDATVHQVMSSGVYTISGGIHNPAFEKEFAEFQGAKYAIAVHSGTDALRIMMDAAGIGAGDEVITTAFTFVASVETIVQTGATPVFVDIDPCTFMIDSAAIRDAITPKTKAILPIHLFGAVADMEALQAIADEHDLVILEDAAQAVEASRGGKMAGTFGLASAFSFYVTKNLGAAGDGGIILTDSEEIDQRCRSIRVHGMGRERYYYDHLGYTGRLDEIQAAVLRVKLKALPAWTEGRRALASVYARELEGAEVLLPRVDSANKMTWHQYSILVGEGDTGEKRDALQAHLKAAEIDSFVYYPVPIHHHAPYAKYGKGEGSLPVTERVSKQILNLPIAPHLDEEAITYVAKTIREFAH